MKAALACEVPELPEIRFEPLAFQVEVTGRDEDRIRFIWHEKLLMRMMLSCLATPVRLSSVI